MTEATARYVIAADDRTKSAISSIKRGFSDLDASAKTVGKTLKGLATGAAFYGLARGVQTLFRNAAASSSTFNDSLESVKKSFRDLTTPKTGIPAATKALDRVLLWHYYVVPQFTYGFLRYARWDRFSHAPLPKYGRSGLPSLWWYDKEKADKIGRRS